MYKVGQIYLKTSNPYITSHYPKVDTNISEFDYVKQFQPFYYSDKFTIYQLDYYLIDWVDPKLYIKHNTIYDSILEHLNYNNPIELVHNIILYTDNNTKINYISLDDKEDSDGDSIGLTVSELEQYLNAVYINNDYCKKIVKLNLPDFDMRLNIIDCKNKLMNNEKYLINGNKMFNNEVIEEDYFVGYDRKRLLINKQLDFWNDLNDIYPINSKFTTSYLKIDTTNKIKFIRDKLNENYLNSSDIELAVILVDKLNIDITPYYFNYSQRFLQLDKSKNYKNKFKLLNTMSEGLIETVIPKIYEPFDKKLKIEFHNNQNIINENFKYASPFCFIEFNNNIYKYNTSDSKYWSMFIKSNEAKYLISYFDLTLDFNNFKNVEYIFIPYGNINNLEMNNLKFCYTKDIKYYKEDEGNEQNKFLNNIIINSSNLFKKFSEEYTNEEIYNLDLRNEIKDYNKFNEIFKNEETTAETIKKLILYVLYDLIDNNIKNIFYNIYYLQMFEILEMIELITKKFIKLDNVLKAKNNVELFNEIFNIDKK